MFKLLSYPLSEKTPLYGETKSVIVEAEKQISKGDSCNTFYLKFSNHSGTHIDSPNHFYENGRSLSQYSIEEFIFTKPFLLDIEIGEGQLITSKFLKNIPTCDLLLIRSGFYKYRNLEKYKFNNPGISVEAAKTIRENYPDIRAIGVDFISISSYSHREEGRQSHRILLDPCYHKNSPILLIEDMNLSDDLAGLKKVFAVPIFFEGVDSMPCTVIGEL